MGVEGDEEEDGEEGRSGGDWVGGMLEGENLLFFYSQVGKKIDGELRNLASHFQISLQVNNP